MATINKPKKKKQVKQGRNKEASEIYNTVKWHKLRQAQLMLHPLCEICLLEGVVSPTEQIHHITPILTGESRLEMEQLAFDPNNLLSVCNKCHHLIHQQKNEKLFIETLFNKKQTN